MKNAYKWGIALGVASLTTAGAILYGPQIMESIRPKPIPEEPSKPILFEWSRITPILSDEFATVKESILEQMTPNDILQITGSFHEAEAAPTGYDNLGLARADSVSRLFEPELARNLMWLRSEKFTGDSDKFRAAAFEATQFYILQKSPLIPTSFDIHTLDLDECKRILKLMETADQEEICDQIDIYLEEFTEKGYCADTLKQYKFLYCLVSKTPSTFADKPIPRPTPRKCQPRNVEGTRYQAVEMGPIWMLTEDVGRVPWQDALQRCPEGWRLPCEEEINYLLNYTYAGDLQKAHTYLSERNNCKPGLHASVGFNDSQNRGLYWCATESTDKMAWGFQLGFVDGRKTVHMIESPKEALLHCRCVQTNDKYKTKLLECPNRPF